MEYQVLYCIVLYCIDLHCMFAGEGFSLISGWDVGFPRLFIVLFHYSVIGRVDSGESRWLEL